MQLQAPLSPAAGQFDRLSELQFNVVLADDDTPNTGKAFVSEQADTGAARALCRVAGGDRASASAIVERAGVVGS